MGITLFKGCDHGKLLRTGAGWSQSPGAEESIGDLEVRGRDLGVMGASGCRSWSGKWSRGQEQEPEGD